MFRALGRASVRFRWVILPFWILLAVVVSATLPSLSSVQKNDNSAFLPGSSPSQTASDLAAPVISEKYATVTFIAAAETGALSPSQNAAVSTAEAALRTTKGVRSVSDQGLSADGAARKANVVLDLPAIGTGDATPSVEALRATLARQHPPAGLSMHIGGSLAQAIDQSAASTNSQKTVENFSILFILVLLLLIFRGLLTPFIALLPSAVGLVVAEPVIAESTHIGVTVSGLTGILLTVVMLGAGTDYGLFLIFRVREEIRRGREAHDAVAFSLEKVGESITFSALTVIAALVSLLLASFGLYKGLGPGLAIGVAIGLLANLTLLPALLAILGRAVFWPRLPKAGEHKRGVWGAAAGTIVGWPVQTLVVGLVLFGGLASAMVAYAPAGFDNSSPPAASDSARAQVLLTRHFPAAETSPTVVVYRFPGSVWDRAQVLATVQERMSALSVFTAVGGPLDATGRPVTVAELAAAHNALAPLGPAADLPLEEPPSVHLGARLYNAYRATSQFISADGRTVLYYTTLRDGAATGSGALGLIPAVRQDTAEVAKAVGAAQSGVAGIAPALLDISNVSSRDLSHVIPVVLLVLALLLALLLRSVVAPIYLVVSVGLSYLASLGLAVLVFVVIGGQDGINFVLPFFMFIFIMALGEDYNILVMTRIREEAHHAPIRVAVKRALGATGTTVTSAGLVLAGTFGVLTVSGNSQVQQIGLGLAAGVLLDTFFVRTLLVPSAVVLLGRWNWWPSHLSHEDHSHDVVVPTEDELADEADAERRARERGESHPDGHRVHLPHLPRHQHEDGGGD